MLPIRSAISVGVVVVAFGWCGCKGPQERTSGRLVAVAGIQWDKYQEQREIMNLLANHGIDLSAGGSKIWGHLCP